MLTKIQPHIHDQEAIVSYATTAVTLNLLEKVAEHFYAWFTTFLPNYRAVV